MRHRLQFEPLEGRDTPSASAVTFTPPPPAGGVPFAEVQITNQLDGIVWTNNVGFDNSAAAFDHAGVWGAPVVIINGT